MRVETDVVMRGDLLGVLTPFAPCCVYLEPSSGPFVPSVSPSMDPAVSSPNIAHVGGDL